MAVSQAKPLESNKLQDSNFETHEKQVNNTLKRNPKMALSRTDLLKLLSYLEAELQARELVIATLKSERVKHLVMQAKMGRFKPTDPYLALQRDTYAAADPQVDEGALEAMHDNQLQKLELLIQHQRRHMNRMKCHLEEAEHRYSKVLHELEEEKCKHEHDTAQGDDVTYALEKERTRLKQELETERQTRKKLEKEIKKLEESIEEERLKVKNIVLLLLAERKKIIIKWVEERKRSEDLAQILSEEKCRLDCMAEGLEEESKKSLEMEEQLEKKSAEFDTERQYFNSLLTKSDQRIKELETELEKARSETSCIKKQLEEAHQVAMFQADTTVTTPAKMIMKPRPSQSNVKASISSVSPAGLNIRMNAPNVMSPPIVGTKPSSATMRSPTPGSSPSLSMGSDSSLSAQPVSSSLTKTVQPTVSIYSVPVCCPATGVAQGVQSRGVVCTKRSGIPVSPTNLNGENLFHSVSDVTNTGSSSQSSHTERIPQGQISPRVTVSGSSTSKGLSSEQMGKVSLQVSPGSLTMSTPISGVNNQTRKPVSLGRGVPPPIPPNKPVIAPKKDVRAASQGSDTTVDHNQPLNFEVKSPKSVSSSVKFGISIAKEKIHLSIPSASEQLVTISNSVQNPNKEGLTNMTPSVSAAPNQSQVGGLSSHLLQVDESEPGLHDLNHLTADSLGQELKNFHQLLCSMAQGSSDINHS